MTYHAAKLAGLLVVAVCWFWARRARLTDAWSVAVIWGAPLLTFPIAIAGRRALDAKPTRARVQWVTILVHYATMLVLGIAIFRAFRIVVEAPGFSIPFPEKAALPVVILTSAVTALTVLNLALRGFGAPFVVKLSSRLATDWMYGWTRNPMLLCTLVWLFSFGLYFRSAWFLTWIAVSISPGWIYLVKKYEERELEIRFGKGYQVYRTQTPFLWPRKPHG